MLLVTFILMAGCYRPVLNQISTFSDYTCGFDLFSLTDSGEIVPGNSFLQRVIYGNCEGFWPLLHHRADGGSACWACSHQFIWAEYFLLRAVYEMVAGRDARGGGEEPEGAAVLLPADKPHLLDVSPGAHSAAERRRLSSEARTFIFSSCRNTAKL